MENSVQPATPPDALMLLGTHCPHCPMVLLALANLVKTGVIGKLEVYNIEARPEVVQELGVRSIPWVRIGPFELEGMHSEKELGQWAAQAGTIDGLANYLDELLSSGRIQQALRLIPDQPRSLDALLQLFASPDTRLGTRIGISAIMEDLSGSEMLAGIVDRLGELTRHEDARVRGDACHYLELSGSERAVPYLTPLLEDPDAGVRDIARESLERLG